MGYAYHVVATGEMHLFDALSMEKGGDYKPLVNKL